MSATGGLGPREPASARMSKINLLLALVPFALFLSFFAFFLDNTRMMQIVTCYFDGEMILV